jgi:DNA-binding NarL/FixJ family response regulator
MASGSERFTASMSEDSGKATIAIIDSRTLVRGCVAHVLRTEFPDLDIVEIRSLNSPCLKDLRQLRLIVIRLEPGSQCETEAEKALGALRLMFPETPIALMSDDDGHNCQQAIRLGCNGYVPTSLSLEIAVAALRLVLVGGVYLPQVYTPAQANGAAVANGHADEPAPLNGVVGHLDHVAPVGQARDLELVELPVVATGSSARIIVSETRDAELPGFTPREIQVIESLQRGRSNKVIAGDLKLSENTVKVHIRHIMRKLKATNRTQAALLSQDRWTQVQTLN